MIKVALCGALGKMGRTVAEEIAADPSLELVAAIEASGHKGIGTKIGSIAVTSNLEALVRDADVVVDFTNPAAALANIRTAAGAGKAAVVGTTGFSAAELSEAKKAADKIPLLISPNMSAGVNLLFALAEEVARTLADFDVEIVEIHHNKKKDSPSGTAAKLAEIIAATRPSANVIHGREGMLGPRSKSEIAVHALRGGDVIGEHTIVFAGEGERMEITHRAHSRRTFARGALRAIYFLYGKAPGLYSMADVLNLKSPR